MVMNDLREAGFALVQILGLPKQLGRVADGAKRVADLMGDVRRQPTQPRQLELLRLLLKLAGVLQKDRDVPAGPHRREVRAHLRGFVLHLEGRRPQT